jgi:nicotinamide-nucleotide amidase
VRVAVVAVGDELLLGDVVNGNLAWLGRTLAAAGLDVVRGHEVGDDLGELVDELREALDSVEAVVVTGGLGPTSDDRTREAVAKVLGVELRRDDSLAAALAAWFAERGRPMPGTALVQADVPEGARSLPNGLGSAPGLAAEVDGRALYAVPGVPAEMRLMVESAVVPELRARAGSPVALATAQLRVAVLGESTVAARLAPVEEALPERVRLAYLASPGEVRVRFTGTDRAELERQRAAAAELLGDVVSGFDDETLAGTVVRLLTERAETVAVAESLTGGALASALVDVPGASVVLRGAVVAYATDVKADLLGVDRGLLDRVGAVHPDVAVAMATGVRALLRTTWGVGTTGVAGPDPQDGVEPGTAYVAVSGPGGPDVAVEVRVRAGRDIVRQASVANALDVLRRRVLGLPPAPDHFRGLEHRA